MQFQLIFISAKDYRVLSAQSDKLCNFSRRQDPSPGKVQWELQVMTWLRQRISLLLWGPTLLFLMPPLLPASLIPFTFLLPSIDELCLFSPALPSDPYLLMQRSSPSFPSLSPSYWISFLSSPPYLSIYASLIPSPFSPPFGPFSLLSFCPSLHFVLQMKGKFRSL